MRVSLIITTYNRPDALLLVLESILSQTIQPDEVIIADDGSDNSTKKSISDFRKSSELNIIHSWQSDKGFRVAKSRNKAIAKSSSKYLILVDGDVILHKKFIEDHLKHAEIGFFVQGPRVLISKKSTKKILGKNQQISFFSRGLKNRKNLLYSNLLATLFSTRKNLLNGIKSCNLAFFKSDCININGFNNDIEGWGREDSEFVVRLMNNGVNRKNVKFNMIQFHLWHEVSSREALQKNDLFLKESVSKKLKWCENGIDQYL